MNIKDALEYVDEHEYSNSKKYSTMDVAKTLAAEVRRLNSAKVNCATHGDMTFGLCPACQKVEKTAIRKSLQWAVCRLYDTELITGSRACELLGGIKAQEFRELYTKWAESI